MRLFIDESLSPSLATLLNATGLHDALHPLHRGRRGERDDQVLARCLAEDRVIVTQNARDFRAMVGRAALHPGLIILPALGRERTRHLLLAAIAFLMARGAPMDIMVNQVLEITSDGAMTLFPLAQDA